MNYRLQSCAMTKCGEEITEHLHRYRISIWAAIRQLPECRKMQMRDIRRQVNHLCLDGKLGTATLFCNQRYLFLASHKGSGATGKTGLSKDHDRTGPFSERAKIQAYAMLSFCCLSEHKRQRLTAEDFNQYFPDMYRPGMPLNYYLDTKASEPRLGFLRVDMGGHGRWDRVLAKARSDVEAHWMKREVRPFIDRGLFEVTVVTALPQKASRLCQALDASTDARKHLLRICVCPELINLIAPPAR